MDAIRPCFKCLLYTLLLILMATPPLMAQATPEDETIEVEMLRPAAAGQRYKVEMSSESQRVQQITRRNKNQEPEAEKRSIQLSGTLEILAVNEVGDMREAQIDITAFQAAALGEPVTGIDAGDTLVLRLEAEDTRYYVDGNPVSEELAELLSFLLKFRPDDAPREMAFFTVEGPQTVGSHWPVNRELAAAQLTRDKVSVDPQDVSGEAGLVELLDRFGEAAYRIQGTVEVDQLDMEMPRLARLDHASTVVEHEGVYPVNTAWQPFETRATLTLEARASGAGLVSFIKFMIREDRTVHVTQIPVELAEREGDSSEAPIEDEDDEGDVEGESDDWEVISVQ